VSCSPCGNARGAGAAGRFDGFLGSPGSCFAAEAERLLSLFRDWVSSVRGQGFRQATHRTRAGTAYEFFSVSDSQDLNIHDEFREFSSFLSLCTTDPAAATEQLLRAGLSRIVSSDIVARYGQEARRLSLDLRQEREQRVLTIRHSFESELFDHAGAGADISQITSLIEATIPDPSPASVLLNLEPVRPAVVAPVTININQQVIRAIESQVVQSVQGTVNLGQQAKEVLELISRFAGE
jgi:hypothetical protein